MLDLSDFIGETIVEREVTYKGKTKTFRFRELTADEAEGIFLGVDTDPKKNKGLRNKIVAKVVVDTDGNQALKEADVGKLPNGFANELQRIALEVNGIGEKAEGEAKNA